MTLDEAIKHARDKANEQKYYASFERGKHIQSCKKCAEEHEQLAEWLEELKDRRETNFNYVQLMDCRYRDGYKKAIDNFFEELEKYEERDGWLRLKMSSIYQIAECLKECEE